MRVALQVNPHDYVVAHRPAIRDAGHAWMRDEDAYNAAMVDDALRNEISLVAITDHFTAASGVGLRKAFEAAGISVIPGFEAKSSEGVHLLCLFPSDRSEDQIERCITELVGANTRDRRNAISGLNVADLAARVASSGGIVLAAHALTGGGLLRLEGQPRVRAWAAPALSGICVDGQVPSASEKRILENREEEYRRLRPLAQLRSADVVGPTFADHQTWTWAKLCGNLGTSGDATDPLRSLIPALAEHDLRISMADPSNPPRWVSRIEWVGSRLFGNQSLDLAPGINVLIGGRGTGKSSTLASAAWVLGLDTALNCDSPDARVPPSEMLAGGGEIRVTTVVDGETSTVVKAIRADGSTAAPMWAVDAFGQGELERRSDEPAVRLRLIERFCDGLSEARSTQERLVAELSSLNERMTDLERQLDAGKSLPEDLEKITLQLQAAQQAGLSEATAAATSARLAHNETLRLSADLEALASQKIPQLAAEIQGDLRTLGSGIDVGSASDLRRVRIADALAKINAAIEESMRSAGEAARSAVNTIGEVLSDDLRLRDASEGERLSILESLNDAEAEVPRLEEKRQQLAARNRERQALELRLVELRPDWDERYAALREARSAELRSLEDGCRKADRAVGGAVKVKLAPRSDSSDVRALLGEYDVAEGASSAVIGMLTSPEVSSMERLVELVREGAVLPVTDRRTLRSFNTALETYDNQFLRDLTLVDLRPSLSIHLNLGVDEETRRHVMKPIEELSVGQRATALLLLTLAGGDSPLLFDQPEDDLDNGFIAKELVTLMRSMGASRQIIVSSHNANIAVLSCPDLVIEMSADGSNARVTNVGSLDKASVAHAVQETLEGGRTAFARRQERYGWQVPG